MRITFVERSEGYDLVDAVMWWTGIAWWLSVGILAGAIVLALAWRAFEGAARGKAARGTE